MLAFQFRLLRNAGDRDGEKRADMYEYSQISVLSGCCSVYHRTGTAQMTVLKLL